MWTQVGYVAVGFGVVLVAFAFFYAVGWLKDGWWTRDADVLIAEGLLLTVRIAAVSGILWGIGWVTSAAWAWHFR